MKFAVFHSPNVVQSCAFSCGLNYEGGNMRRVKSVLLAIVVVLFATQVVIAAGSKTKPIDFWFVKKGSVSIPSGWEVEYEEFCDKLPYGQYCYSGHTMVYYPRLEDASVSIVAADMQDEKEAREAMQDIPGSMKRVWANSKTKLSFSKSKIGRVGGGSYTANKYAFRIGDIDQVLYICKGQPTKYRSGVRYQGLDVTPVYIIHTYCPHGNKTQLQDR
jgi:hypothetical protein